MKHRGYKMVEDENFSLTELMEDEFMNYRRPRWTGFALAVFTLAVIFLLAWWLFR